MTTAIATQPGPLESLLILGDLSKLTSEQRATYYTRVCESLRLNPLTKPFDYVSLSGKLTFYARKDCTEQLRKRDGVSVKIVGREAVEGVYVVTAQATTPDGRTDESIGAVTIEGAKGEMRANAMMKAETKAKRRVTLSICGLGMLDETEIDSIPGARVVDAEPAEPPKPQPAKELPAAKPAEPTQKLADKIAELVTPGDPVSDVKAFNALCLVKGLSWPDIVKGANKQFDAKYTFTRTKWLDVDKAHRAKIVEALGRKPDTHDATGKPLPEPTQDGPRGVETPDSVESLCDQWAKLSNRSLVAAIELVFKVLRIDAGSIDNLTQEDLRRCAEYARAGIREATEKGKVKT